jgi:hypothetical protein
MDAGTFFEIPVERLHDCAVLLVPMVDTLDQRLSGRGRAPHTPPLAGGGYDGPTDLGSPNGTGGF